MVDAKKNPGEVKTFGGIDYWVEPDGYTIEMKFVNQCPHLWGPWATDPDHGCGDDELDDNIAQFFRKIDGIGGMFSTSGERHCYQGAALYAYLFVESTAGIPPVPKFWIPEGHYWNSGIVAGRLLKKKNLAEAASLMLETIPGLLQDKATLARITAIAGTAMAAGAVAIPPLLQALPGLWKTLGIV